MSIAENIKRAALGPAPKYPHILRNWIGAGHEWHTAVQAIPYRMRNPFGNLKVLSASERRMFLLFVAYSLGAK